MLRLVASSIPLESRRRNTLAAPASLGHAASCDPQRSPFFSALDLAPGAPSPETARGLVTPCLVAGAAPLESGRRHAPAPLNPSPSFEPQKVPLPSVPGPVENSAPPKAGGGGHAQQPYSTWSCAELWPPRGSSSTWPRPSGELCTSQVRSEKPARRPCPTWTCAVTPLELLVELQNALVRGAVRGLGSLPAWGPSLGPQHTRSRAQWSSLEPVALTVVHRRRSPSYDTRPGKRMTPLVPAVSWGLGASCLIGSSPGEDARGRTLSRAVAAHARPPTGPHGSSGGIGVAWAGVEDNGQRCVHPLDIPVI